VKSKLFLCFITIFLSCCLIFSANPQSTNEYNICIDKTFSAFENFLIKDQFKLWQFKIHNKFRFKFKENCDVDIKSFMSNPNDVMVLNFDKTNEFIAGIDKDQEPGVLTIGVYHFNKVRFIGLMTFRITSYEQFKKVTLHEIGHLIGLKHGKSNTVMYKLITDETTDLIDHDVKEFCSIYGC